MLLSGGALDDDGVVDCTDDCPDDPDKGAPGTCGCGVPDTDTDGDGLSDGDEVLIYGSDPLDTDTDGDTMTVTSVGAASHGTAQLVTGQVRYTPTAGYSGSDSFSCCHNVLRAGTRSRKPLSRAWRQA